MIDRASIWVLTHVWELRDREDGQAVAEYGVLLALILIAAIAAITLLGGQISGAFTSVKNSLSAAI
jgi:Flp pilus assembly pilin Flp